MVFDFKKKNQRLFRVRVKVRVKKKPLVQKFLDFIKN